jgi:hypothetical protein
VLKRRVVRLSCINNAIFITNKIFGAALKSTLLAVLDLGTGGRDMTIEGIG